MARTFNKDYPFEPIRGVMPLEDSPARWDLAYASLAPMVTSAHANLSNGNVEAAQADLDAAVTIIARCSVDHTRAVAGLGVIPETNHSRPPYMKLCTSSEVAGSWYDTRSIEERKGQICSCRWPDHSNSPGWCDWCNNPMDKSHWDG